MSAALGSMVGVGPNGAPAARICLVDGHVHLHARLAIADLLEQAHLNFAAAARRQGLDSAAAGWLLLTDAAGADTFARLGSAAGAWALRPTAEVCTMVACRAGAPPLVLVAGRQIASAEGIEVLALGTRAGIPDGRPLAETIAAVSSVGALAVLPWGFGKWWGRRGRLVAAQLAAARPGELFLGDNGNRPALSRRPRLFAVAERRGIAVLPGSDPLPLDQEDARIGCYGFLCEAPFDPAAPWTALRRRIAGLTASPAPFGRRARLPTFLHRQIAMQVRKRPGAA